MLRTRILTAVVVLPLAVAGILWLPTAAVAAVLAALLAVGAWEWARLASLTSVIARRGFVVAGLVVFALLWYPPVRAATAWAVLLLAVLWWLAAVVLVARFPRGWDLSVGVPAVAAALGLLVLAAPYVGLVTLHAGSQGAALMLLMFVLIWAADTGAYFAGRAWGRHKLAPRVSPGKTREGAIGGIALALLAAAIGGWLLEFHGLRLAAFVLLGGVTAAVSIVGDLAISMFKRQAGVKDSGTLFPGHGGVLDRLDSMLAAAPVFVLGLALIAP